MNPNHDSHTGHFAPKSGGASISKNGGSKGSPKQEALKARVNAVMGHQASMDGAGLAGHNKKTSERTIKAPAANVGQKKTSIANTPKGGSVHPSVSVSAGFARMKQIGNKMGNDAAHAASARRDPGPAARGAMKALKREGNVSVKGGTSKAMVTKTASGFKEIGTKTVFSAASLKATLHNVAGANKKNPYRAATIVTQRGAFQASVGKKMFTGGSTHARDLKRPSIGKGFHMTARGSK